MIILKSQSIAEHAVRSATPVLPLLHLQPERYKAIVDEWEGAYRVGFIDKDAQDKGAMGNYGRIPGIQVKIDPVTFHIIRYGLIR